MPFDHWFSLDIGHGVGMSNSSFNLSESFFSGIQNLSIILTVASVYSHRELRGILFPPGSHLHLLFVDLW